MSLKILCIGEEWKGSNASGLFYAISRTGCLTNVVNEQRYINTSAANFGTKVVNKVIRGGQIADFNDQLTHITISFAPDLALVYTGAYIEPKTILFWKSKGIRVVNFFPDVNFLAHGHLIPQCIP